MSNTLILFGYMSGGIVRGVIVGIIVAIIALLFTHLHVYSVSAIIIVTLLSACIFSLAGIINAVYAKSFDDISIIPTFVLTPLTYLGGVFYSISLLPPLWQHVSLVNPIIYIVDNFRYGFLGVSDGHVFLSYMVMVLCVVVLFSFTFYIMKKGAGLRE